ncbi:type II toxin-antitoxin system Phd/YefM family antitoxin [bacterium CPR1]|nr:type II toxin-antitoxin system Phd/YefM family antitoxin [bacterium CPR1]
MAHVVNVHEAKTNLSRLLEEVERGEEVIIARAGTHVARLVPMQPVRRRRRPGGAEGLVAMSEDFDAPLPPGFAFE